MGLSKALSWEAKSTQIREKYGNSFPLQGSLTRMRVLEALVLLIHYYTTQPHSHRVLPVWHIWLVVGPWAILKIRVFLREQGKWAGELPGLGLKTLLATHLYVRGGTQADGRSAPPRSDSQALKSHSGWASTEKLISGTFLFTLKSNCISELM